MAAKVFEELKAKAEAKKVEVKKEESMETKTNVTPDGNSVETDADVKAKKKADIKAKAKKIGGYLLAALVGAGAVIGGCVLANKADGDDDAEPEQAAEETTEE